MISVGAFTMMVMALFGIGGMLRSWHEEFLVTSSIVLAWLVFWLADKYVPALIVRPDAHWTLSVRILIFLLLVFLGYQTPRRFNRAPKRGVFNAAGQALVGGLLGALNGYLMVVTLWFYFDKAGYPWPHLVSPPLADDTLARTLLQSFPTVVFGPPWIYFWIVVTVFVILAVFI